MSHVQFSSQLLYHLTHIADCDASASASAYAYAYASASASASASAYAYAYVICVCVCNLRGHRRVTDEELLRNFLNEPQR